MPEIINAVGGGDLDQELDLNISRDQIDGDTVRYDPEHWVGLYLRLTPQSPAAFVFSSGKYNIAGARSVEHLLASNEELISSLESIGITITDPQFEIRNFVFIDDFGAEMDLEQLAVGLNLESVEYDPEQFPGLFYRSTDIDGTFMLFRTGKILLTGINDVEEGQKAFDTMLEKLNTLFT